MTNTFERRAIMLAQRTPSAQLPETPATTAAVEMATANCNALIDLTAARRSDFASSVRKGVSLDSDQDDIPRASAGRLGAGCVQS